MLTPPALPAHAAGGSSEPPARGLGLLASRRGRRALFALLYFAEGAPIGFVWWTLPVLLKRQGLSPEAIGALTGTLVLPWAFKFLWAPAVDVLRGPRLGLRGWIVGAQVAMITCLAPLLLLDAMASPALLTAILSAHAMAAATQDVAIDALAVESIEPSERGAINGWMQAGMLAGRGLFGGVVIGWREELGTHGIVLLLMLVVAATLPVHLAYRPPPAPAAARRAGFAELLRSALGARRTWWVLAFAATSGVAFEAAGSMAGPYLVDLGFTDQAIAGFFALPAVLGLGLGALAGGAAADRLGHGRVVAGAGLAVAASTAGLALASQAPPALLWAVLGLVYLAAGAFIAASYALFMDATDRRLAATQFSTYMGATNLCESWSALLAGRLAAGPGYSAAFGTGAVLGAASLALLIPIHGGSRKTKKDVRP